MYVLNLLEENLDFDVGEHQQTANVTLQREIETGQFVSDLSNISLLCTFHSKLVKSI